MILVTDKNREEILDKYSEYILVLMTIRFQPKKIKVYY